jgi:hypothetical protein
MFDAEPPTLLIVSSAVPRPVSHWPRCTRLRHRPQMAVRTRRRLGGRVVRLAGGDQHAHRVGPRRARAGCLGSRPPWQRRLVRIDRAFGCRIAIARRPRLAASTTSPSARSALEAGAIDSTSVSNATSASCCTSADDLTSSEPSSAWAVRPALLPISSARRASIVCAAMMHQGATGCPSLGEAGGHPGLQVPPPDHVQREDRQCREHDGRQHCGDVDPVLALERPEREREHPQL